MAWCGCEYQWTNLSINLWRLWSGRVLHDWHGPLDRSVFLVLSRASITLLNLNRRCRIIFCAMIINEVAYFRGINFLSLGIIKNAKIYIEKIIGRVEVSRNRNFDHLTIINHLLLSNYTRQSISDCSMSKPSKFTIRIYITFVYFQKIYICKCNKES